MASHWNLIKLSLSVRTRESAFERVHEAKRLSLDARAISRSSARDENAIRPIETLVAILLNQQTAAAYNVENKTS